MTFQTVRGTKDLLGCDYAHAQHITDVCFKTTALYGFQPMATPVIEFSDVFKRLGDTSDVVSKEMYTFLDRGGESLTLRPEGTAPVVRAVISNGLTQTMPLKLSSVGPMFRYERPQKGRQRQFHQFGIEFFGPDTPLADAEVIIMAQHVLENLGIKSGADSGLTLRLNSLGCVDSRQTYTAALVAYLTPYQASLSPESQLRLTKNPLRILDSKDNGDQEILKNAPVFSDYWTPAATAHFRSVCARLDDSGVAYTVDQTVVRGLDYYCHTAFEFTHVDLGAQGAVLAGGRYNGLSENLGGPEMAAIGWALGIERVQILTAAPEKKRPLAFVLPVSETDHDHAFDVAHQLRQQGVQVQMLYSGSIKKQLKKVSVLRAKHAIFCGGSEQQQGGALVKNLDTSHQEFIHFTHLASFLRQEAKG